MNRSILLVICDFLLLSLLALAKFDEVEAEEPVEVVEQARQEESMEADLVEVLRMSLEAGQTERNELEQAVQDKAQALEESLKSVESLEAEKQQLEHEQAQLAAAKANLEEEKQRALSEKLNALEEASRAKRLQEQILNDNRELSARNAETVEKLIAVERARVEMAQEVGNLKETTASSQTHLQFLQEELREQQSAMAEYEQAQDRLELEKRAIEAEKQSLQTRLQVASTETRLYSEQLATARQDIEASRESVELMQRHATELASGVSVLAASTDKMREEVKQLQPLSANTVFDRFKSNRVRISWNSTRKNLFGSYDNTDEVVTVLVADGSGAAYALMHISETPFDRSGLESVNGSLYLGGDAYAISRVTFLTQDPRIVVAEIPIFQLQDSGASIVPFNLATDPLRFPDAVLIDNEENYYGESNFKLLSSTNRHVRMPTTVFSRVFGEFSPQRSDLIFAKTGEFIGVMVDSEFGSIISSFEGTSIWVDDAFDGEQSGQTLEAIKRKIRSLRNSL